MSTFSDHFTIVTGTQGAGRSDMCAARCTTTGATTPWFASTAECDGGFSSCSATPHRKHFGTQTQARLSILTCVDLWSLAHARNSRWLLLGRAVMAPIVVAEDSLIHSARRMQGAEARPRPCQGPGVGSCGRSQRSKRGSVTARRNFHSYVVFWSQPCALPALISRKAAKQEFSRASVPSLPTEAAEGRSMSLYNKGCTVPRACLQMPRQHKRIWVSLSLCHRWFSVY